MTEAKGEILRESSGISSHLFKQPLGRHTIEVREIAIENNLNASYRMDEGKWRNGRGHGGCVSWQPAPAAGPRSTKGFPAFGGRVGAA
jgi:hypothetical protein